MSKIMDIKFREDEPLFTELQDLYNGIGYDALYMTHYELAQQTGTSPIDWKQFLMDPRVTAFVAEEIDMLKKSKVALMLKDVETNKNTGQSQLLNTLLSKQKYKLYRLQRSLKSAKDECVVDTTQLSLFFPTINIQEVDKINEFHGQLIGILKAKLLAEIKVCQNLITEYNIQMEIINQEINKILKCKNPVGLAVDNLIRLNYVSITSF